MGTGNFHNVNASKVFAIECDDEFEYDDVKSNIFYGLNDKFGEKNVFAEDKSPDDELRSFPANVFALVEGKCKSYMEDSVYPIVEVISRSGYYQGANFDYNTYFQVGSDCLYDIENLDVEFLAESFQHADFYTDKQLELYVKRIRNFLTKEKEIIENKIEEVFTENTMPLVVSARFSNGETWYEKAN